MDFVWSLSYVPWQVDVLPSTETSYNFFSTVQRKCVITGESWIRMFWVYLKPAMFEIRAFMPFLVMCCPALRGLSRSFFGSLASSTSRGIIPIQELCCEAVWDTWHLAGTHQTFVLATIGLPSSFKLSRTDSSDHVPSDVRLHIHRSIDPQDCSTWDGIWWNYMLSIFAGLSSS